MNLTSSHDSDFLQENFSLLERVNNELGSCYQQGEQRLANHLHETVYHGNSIFYFWGVAKLCIQLVEYIYGIVTPFIVRANRLQRQIKSNGAYRTLVVPIPTSFTSRVLNESRPLRSPCIDLVRVADLKAACSLYFKQVEEDVKNLRIVLKKMRPVQEPANPDAYGR